MSNTLTIPTTITWNKLTTRPLTDEEKEEYNQQYGEGVIDFHWDGPTPYDEQFVLVYAEGWNTWTLLKQTNGLTSVTAALVLILMMTLTPFIGLNCLNLQNPFRKKT